MIALLAKAAVAIGVPERFRRAAAWAALATAAVVVLGVIAWRVYDHISDAGGAKVKAEVAKRDDGRRVEVRADERAAQVVAGAIGADVGRRTRAVDIQLISTTKDIRDAFDALPPPAAAGAAPPPAPVDQLRAAINAGTERANRAAEAAGARR